MENKFINCKNLFCWLNVVLLGLISLACGGGGGGTGEEELNVNDTKIINENVLNSSVENENVVIPESITTKISTTSESSSKLVSNDPILVREDISRLSDFRVSQKTDYDTTKTGKFTLNIQELNLVGSKFFMKISYDQDMKNHFYLGEVNGNKTFTLDIVCPKSCGEIFYQVYSNQGSSVKASYSL